MKSQNVTVKLAYGKGGLIAFLERIFRGTGIAERQQDFNYYFALKAQLLEMEKVDLMHKFYDKSQGLGLEIGDE